MKPVLTMNNTTLTDNPINDLTILQRAEFLGKLVIAAQHGYFGECSDIVNKAQSNGLFERIKPIGANNEQIKDLDNPISNTLNY